MHLSKSVCVIIFLSCVILSSSPVSASALLPIHDSQSDSQSNSDDSGYFFTPPDGFQPPPPPPYQDDILGSPPIGAPNSGNADLLHSVLPPTAPADDVTLTPPIVPPTDNVTPPIVPPPTSDTPLTPKLPVTLAPPPDDSLPVSPPQLPFASPPPDTTLPESPQLLPLASPPTPYNTLPGSPHSPLPYHHPGDTQPGTSTAPAPFGVNPGGENQGQQFGQANSGLFGQQQSTNGLPFAGQIGGCGSTRAGFVGIAVAFVGIMLIYWV